MVFSGSIRPKSFNLFFKKICCVRLQMEKERDLGERCAEFPRKERRPIYRPRGDHKEFEGY